MPEGYTHIRTATNALSLSSENVVNNQAFLAGANGPDILFCYKAWSKKAREFPLPDLGNRMHRERTGEFLINMINLADSDIKKSFTLGFLTHYALDSNAHPFVYYMCEGENAKYKMSFGHGFYEIALDSSLHKLDTAKRTIPIEKTAPSMYGMRLIEVCALLRDSIKMTFDLDVPFIAFSEAFHDMRFMRKFFISKFKIKYCFGWLLERAVFHKKGFITCHMQPQKMKKPEVNEWTNPFTKETCEGGITALLKLSERTGAAFIKATVGYWNGLLTEDQMRIIIGNKSYDTGLNLK